MVREVRADLGGLSKNNIDNTWGRPSRKHDDSPESMYEEVNDNEWGVKGMQVWSYVYI